ncbi:hypothetical protein KDL29_01995 [bacterium]|nr:hypothetical protein [bacterium]
MAEGKFQLQLSDLRKMLFTTLVGLPRIPVGTLVRPEILLERPQLISRHTVKLEIVAVTLDQPVKFGVYLLEDLRPHVCPTRLSIRIG